MTVLTAEERKVINDSMAKQSKIKLPSIEYIVITYPKNHHICHSILETWGANKKILFLSDINEGNNIINFGGDTGYKNIYTKYIGLFKNYTPKSDWIVFCDDDSFILEKNLIDFLKCISPKLNICIGKIGELNQSGLDSKGRRTGFPYKSLSGKDISLPLLYPSGGAGFVISNHTFQLIKEIIHDNPETAFNSDVAIGFWLRRIGASLLHNNKFNHTNPELLNHDNNTIRESISYHYIKNHHQIYKRLEND